MLKLAEICNTMRGKFFGKSKFHSNLLGNRKIVKESFNSNFDCKCQIVFKLFTRTRGIYF